MTPISWIGSGSCEYHAVPCVVWVGGHHRNVDRCARSFVILGCQSVTTIPDRVMPSSGSIVALEIQQMKVYMDDSFAERVTATGLKVIVRSIDTITASSNGLWRILDMAKI